MTAIRSSVTIALLQFRGLFLRLSFEAHCKGQEFDKSGAPQLRTFSGYL